MRIRSSENTAVLRDVEYHQAEDTAPPPATGNIEPPDNLVIGAFDPDDAFDRAARSLRMSIAAASSFDGSPIRSVALLGIDTDDETSILAASLADSYARAGSMTVLIDADFVNARRHPMLDSSTSQAGGLVAVLQGDVDARAAVTATSMAGLFVLGLGSLGVDTPIPSNGERFHRRVKPLLETFAMIVVDAGTSFEDPPAMCEAIDAVVLIVRRNRTVMAQAQQYIGRLTDMKISSVWTLIIE